jgi:zinc/manganese transport system permease protein
MNLWHLLWPTGLLANAAVRTGFVIGTVVAVSTAVVGVGVIIRGQAFSGHALGDVGSTGAAAAYLTGVDALLGFLVAGIMSGLAMEELGDRVRERDIATGVVLAFMIGLSALLLYWVSIDTGTSNAPMAILFGSLFTVNPAITPWIFGLSGLVLATMAVIYRPLLFASILPEVAKVRGVSQRWMGLAFMVVLAISVEQTALAVGALLSTAVLVGPAATAARITVNPARAFGLAVLIATAQVWLGIVLAYDSFLWPPVDRGWPVSFFVTTLVVLTYLAVSVGVGRRRRHHDHQGWPDVDASRLKAGM